MSLDIIDRTAALEKDHKGRPCISTEMEILRAICIKLKEIELRINKLEGK